MTCKILVVGRTGQVAYELRRGAWPAGTIVDFLEQPELDLARPDQARDIVIAARPQIVVNAAAYTAVDAAETDRTWLLRSIATVRQRLPKPAVRSMRR
jgi:dTDP-4-dehydrorhamnose reductase